MNQIVAICLVAVLVPVLVLAAPAESTQEKRSASRKLSNPALTLAVLAELMETIANQHGLDTPVKRGAFDAGYSSRFASAANYGKKLMALQAATDWQGPGRRRRNAAQQH